MSFTFLPSLTRLASFSVIRVSPVRTTKRVRRTRSFFWRSRRLASMTEQATTSARRYGNVLSSVGGRELNAIARTDPLAAAIYSSPPYDVTVPPLGMARLSINLSESQAIGKVDGERSRAFEPRRHSLFLPPAALGPQGREPSSIRPINTHF